jgi:hypothetical protein
MTAFPCIRDRAEALRAQRVLPLLVGQLFGAGRASSNTDRSSEEVPVPATPEEPAPGDVMEDVLATCAGRGSVAMIQVMLEIALRGAGGEALSPERVGRWLSSHSRVDHRRPTERRRLYGQISRIYPLIAIDGRSGEAADAFRFCTDQVCGGCRYQQVCPAEFPELRRRKQSL